MSNFQSISLEALTSIHGGQTRPRTTPTAAPATGSGTTSTGSNVAGPADRPAAPVRRNHIDIGAYAETLNHKEGVTIGYRRDLNDHSNFTINAQAGTNNGRPDNSIRAGYHLDF